MNEKFVNLYNLMDYTVLRNMYSKPMELTLHIIILII